MKKIINILFLYAIFCFECYCVSYTDEFVNWNIRRFTAPDDLPNEVIRDVIMARDGSVWMASWGGGVVVFEGTKKRVITTENGLISNDVRVLVEDKENRIWVGTANGISCIHGDNIYNYSPDTVSIIPENGSIYAIECMENGEVWFGDELSNLYAWIPPKNSVDVQRGAWKFIHRFTEKNKTGISRIKQFSNHQIWLVVNNAGFVRIQLSGEYEINPWLNMHPDMSSRSRDIVCISPDHMMCIVYEKVFESTERKIHLVHTAPYLITCAEYAFGRLFYGTDRGLYVLDDNQERFFPLTSDRSDNYIESLSYVKDGSMWVGTRKGVFRVSQPMWISQHPPDSKSAFIGQSLLSTDKKHIFCIDDERRIWTYKDHSWTFLDQIEPLGDTTHIEYYNCNYQSNTLFICNHFRLIEFDLTQKKISEETLFPGDTSVGDHNPFLITSNNEVWFASAHGILCWQRERFNPVFDLSHHDDPSVCTILESTPGEYWLGGKGWIDHWKDGRLIDPKIPNSFMGDGNKILASLKTQKNELWFAQLGKGILRCQDGKWIQETIHTGLKSNYIRALFQSSDGTIWAGDRNRGIMSFKDGRWIQYGFDDGVPVGEVISIAEDDQQRIWIGIIDQGIYALNSDDQSPTVEIVSAPDRLVPDARGVFSYLGSDVWNQTPRDKLVYSWRVMEEDSGQPLQEWSAYSTTNSVLLPPLRPGRYLFEVKAQDAERNTSEIPARASFLVVPYFWQTYSFQVPVVLSVFFASLSLYLFVKRYHKVRISAIKYKSMVEQDTYTIIMFWNADYRLTYVNECAQNLLGIRQEDLESLNVLDTVFSHSHEVRKSIERIFRELNEDRLSYSTITLPTLTRNGELLWISWLFRVSHFHDNLSVEIHSFGTDVTPRKKAEDELKIEKIGFEEFCESAQIGVFRKSTTLELVYANNAMAQIAGFESVQEMMNCDNPLQWDKEYLYGRFLHQLKNGLKVPPVVLKGHQVITGKDYYVKLYGVLKQDEIDIMAVDVTKEKKLEKEIVTTSAKEQQKIGRDLHDSILQELTGISYLTQSVLKKAKKKILCNVEEINTIIGMLNDVRNKTRIISKGLSPFTVGKLGLHSALQELTSSTQKLYSISCEYFSDYTLHIGDDEIELHLYHIAHEAVTNAAKHSRAKRIQIHLEENENEIVLTVTDDGAGISHPEEHDGMGIQIMKLRASVILAELNINRRIEGGTVVECRYPRRDR